MRAIVAVAGALALVAGGAAAAAQADVDAAATQSEYARQDLGGDAFNSAAATVTFRAGRNRSHRYLCTRPCLQRPGHVRVHADPVRVWSRNTRFADGFDVLGARVAVCHDNGDHEAGTGDPCSFSAWMTNPHV